MPLRPPPDAAAGAALGLAAALAAGAACAWLRTPIPWMLGPLFAIAALKIAGIDVRAPPGARQVGQWVIGTSLGLYFTPVVMRQVGSLWYWPLVAAAGAVIIGYVSGALLARVSRLDLTTSVFASVPGGAAEMSTLGERYGARADFVVAAQSLRILLVIAIVPAAFTLAGVRGTDAYVAGPAQFHVGGFVVLMAATLAGGAVVQRLDVPNAFVLGALVVAIPLTALDVSLSSMPALVGNGAQLLLGCAIGARFEPDSLRGAPRFVGGVVVSVLLSIALAAALGVLLALLSRQQVATVVLGTAPGGIAEMAITAKALELGVPLVTAFHVTRVIVLLVVTGPLFGRARAWRRRGGG